MGGPHFVAVQVKGEIDLSNAGQVTGLADGLHDSTAIVLDMSVVASWRLLDSPRYCGWPRG